MSGLEPSLTWEDVCALAQRLPDVSRSTYYGYPALKVRGRFMAGSRDGQNLILPMDFESRAFLLSADPEVFHLTDHYREHPYVLVRLAVVGRSRLLELLEDAWGAADGGTPRKKTDGGDGGARP